MQKSTNLVKHVAATNLWFKCAHGHTWRRCAPIVSIPHCPHCSESTDGKRIPGIFVGAKKETE